MFLPSPVKAFGAAECVPRASLPDKYSALGCVDDCREDFIYEVCSCVGPSVNGNSRFILPAFL